MTSKRKLLKDVTNTRNIEKKLEVEKGHITTDKDLYILDEILHSEREVFFLDDYQIELSSDSF